MKLSDSKTWPKPTSTVWLVLITAIAAVVRLQNPDLAWFNTHMSRDLSRSLDWLSGQPSSFLGPELNYSGGRLFGPALYFFYALVWLLTGSVPLMLAFLNGLAICLAYFLARWIQKDLGLGAAVFFLLSFLLMPVQVSVARTLWNPCLIVTLNLGYLLCVRNFCEPPHKKRYLVLFFFLGWLGLQVHLSLLSGLLAGAVLMGQRARAWRPVRIGAGLIFLYVILILATTGTTEALTISVARQYDLALPPAQKAMAFLSWLGYHLFISAKPLMDYELFPVLFTYGRELFPSRFAWIDFFIESRWIFYVFFFPSLFLLLHRLSKKKFRFQELSFYEALVLVWSFFSIVPMIFYTAKGNILPYRYGLAWYPVQFLIIPVAWRLLQGQWEKHSKKRFALGAGVFSLSLWLFVGNGLYLISSYKTMAASGVASHVKRENNEIPLKYKLSLLRVSRELGEERGVFTYLHGAVVNKVRLKEFDWAHTEHYGGLSRTLGPAPSGFSLPKGHYFVDRFSPNEMKENAKLSDPAFPFHFRPLGNNDLPGSLDLEILDTDGHSLSRYQVPAGSPLLPLDPPSERAVRFTARFHLAQSEKPVLRVCFDYSDRGETVSLTSALLDGHKLPVRTELGIWLGQSVARVMLPPDSGTRTIELQFHIARPRERFSRVDIFRTVD